MSFISKSLLMAALVGSGGIAQAQERSVQIMTPDTYAALPAKQLAPAKLYYSETIESFSDWNQKSPAEAQVLVLFPGYQEPTVKYLKGGTIQQIKEVLMMYVARTKTVLNRPAAQINLSKMITLDSIQQLSVQKDAQGNVDKVLEHPISSADFMPNVVGKKPITNFDWCNQGGDYIERPKKEIDMSFLDGHSWCQVQGRTTCVESCYIFSKSWQTGVKMASKLLDAKAAITGDESDRKDLGIAFQSEVRYYLNEAEYGAKVPLSQLTHINSPVRGILEQNMFYFNQVFQYGKLVSILQDQEGDSNKTVMTNFIVMGVRNRSWVKYPMLPEILEGTGLFNTSTGLTAGIPIFTQNMTQEIAHLLEQ